jgi:hypothetical protein
MSPLIPPKSASEVAFAGLTDAAGVPLAEVAAPDVLAEGVVAVVELLLEQPAASNIVPTAAAVATIDLEARNVKPSHAAPSGYEASLGISARQVPMVGLHA